MNFDARGATQPINTVGQTTVINSYHDTFDLFQKLAPQFDASYTRGNTEVYVARCQDGTRREVLDLIKTWFDVGRLYICWLNGPAGSGKSAVAQTFAEWAATKGVLAASFFFFRGSGHRSKFDRFIPTLVYQLCRFLPSVKPHIEQVIRDEPTIFDSALKHQCMELVIKPIQMAGDIGRGMVIVIDGLDECDDKSTMAEFIQSMAEIFREKGSLPFKIFFTSRVEEHLRKPLEDPAVYSLRLEDFDATSDITDFFRNRFRDIHQKHINTTMRGVLAPWPSPSELWRLVEMAERSFIFAETIIRFVGDGSSSPQRKLEAVFEGKSGLDQLYTQVLSSAPQDENFERVICTIVLLTEPLPIVNLAQLLQLTSADVVQALLGIQSIVFIPGDDEQPIQLYHTSLRDFMTTQSRAGQFYVPSSAQMLLANDCVNTMIQASHDVFFNDKAAGYACTNWLNHFQEGMLRNEVNNAALNMPRMDCIVDFVAKSSCVETWFNHIILRTGADEPVAALESVLTKLKLLRPVPRDLRASLKRLKEYLKSDT